MKTILFAALALVSALVANARQITFAWDANPPAQNVAEYRLFVKAEDGSLTPLGTTPGTELQAEIPDTVCTVVAYAVNSLGLVSDESAPLVIPETPTAPKGLRIKITIEIDDRTKTR